MLMKIGDITNKFGVSHRSLHYWEDMGIIKSSREENDYRYYDEENQRKIQQIIILRKLRLSLKQIIMILESENTVEIIDNLQQNLSEIDDEITALSTIRCILNAFITKLNENIMIDVKINLLDDSSILEIADSLIISRPILKEEKTAKDLLKADEQLTKFTDRDIRIVYLPPVTVASALGVGDDAEHEADIIMGKFMKDVDLFKINPSSKFYGFNNPIFKNGRFIQHRYEMWVTIPNDLEVSAPLTKKTFDGGLYAAYTSKPVSFEEWKQLFEWVKNNEDFEYNGSKKPDNIPCSGWGCLEEHFNSYNLYGLKNEKHVLAHIDFLMPVKEKKTKWYK